MADRAGVVPAEEVAAEAEEVAEGEEAADFVGSIQRSHMVRCFISEEMAR